MPAQARSHRSAVRLRAPALPRRVRRPRPSPKAWLVRLAPTRRSLAVGFGIVGCALGAYVLARETSMFAVSTIQVKGGSPRVAAQVRAALSSVAGSSLVGLDGSAVLQKVDALPTVVRASYDRAFPHTLRVSVVPERPAAVLRRGPDSWLVSTRGRVMERLPSGATPRLTRVWVGGRTPVRVGEELPMRVAGTAARAAGLAGAFGARAVTSASYAGGSLVFHLRSGLQLVLGNATDVRLKVAVAQRALGLLQAGSTFLDVSVPGRPVSGTGPLKVSQAQKPPQGSGGG